MKFPLAAIEAGAAPKPRVPRPPLPQLDAAKLRVEIMRLQSQVKKLEAELRAERELLSRAGRTRQNPARRRLENSSFVAANDSPI